MGESLEDFVVGEVVRDEVGASQSVAELEELQLVAAVAVVAVIDGVVAELVAVVVDLQPPEPSVLHSATP